MVEILPTPTHVQNGGLSLSQGAMAGAAGVSAVATRVLIAANLASRQDSKMITREEHAAMMLELNKKRAGYRAPRRAWSATDYPADADAATTTSQNASPLATVTSSNDAAAEGSRPKVQEPVAASPMEEQDRIQSPPLEERKSRDQAPRRRPALGAPRRSYSVMDYEPAPRIHRPSSRMGISDLPSDVHFAIFDFLDPIDSTCFGLVNKHFYAISQRMHGKIPLSRRRNGPNDLEWAWRGAGPLISPSAQPTAFIATTTNTLGGQDNTQALERLRVKGQVYCRKCGISRCELHRHLREWMGDAYEYCSVKQIYGRPAPEGAKEFCHMSSPKNPHRCGRHGGKPKVQKS